MSERDPIPDIIEAITRTMEGATVAGGTEAQGSGAERIRSPTDVISPDDFPRSWLDRNFGGINSYFVKEFGQAKAPLQASMDRLQTLGAVTLLDVGCGTGNTLCTWTDTLRQFADSPSDVRAIGLNLHDYSDESGSPRTREAIRNREIEYLLGDAQSMFEIPKESTDIVLAFMSLIHMRRPLRAVRHIERVLRPGGVAFMQVDSDMMLSSSPLAIQVYRWVDDGYDIQNTPFASGDIMYMRLQKPEAS